MNNCNVLILGEKLTFMINALVTNLKKEGYTVEESGFDIKNIAPHEESADVVVLFADNTLLEKQDVMAYLKDSCMEKGKKMVLIGVKEEINAVSAYIPSHLWADIVERPLDVTAFTAKLDALMNKGEAEGRNKSILLVDDDASFLQLLYGWLKNDYRVGMAKSGMQAITWLARNNVDLILLDYEMPVVSGLQMFEMLKSEQFSKDIPIMFLTSKSDRESIMKVMKLKPDGYILKDVNKEQLLTNLEKFFRKEKS
ncbi:MAG: response regulator [Lachnospiraceae bacterium]|nr:response regulator [Lachnospiraceae bacterium]